MIIIYEEEDKEKILEVALRREEIENMLKCKILFKKIDIMGKEVHLCVRLATIGEHYGMDQEKEALE